MTGAMKLSAADIAFEGFRVVRDRPLALLAWVVLQFLGALAAQPALQMGRDAQAQLEKLGLMPTVATPQLTPAQLALAMPAMGSLFEGAAMSLAVLLVVAALTDPGVFRVAMTPQDRGLFSVKLGAQELRQLGLLLILSALFFGIALCGMMASLLFTGVFAVAGPAASLLGLAVGVTATLCVLIYFGVRLSLAGPLTFQQKRIDVFGSWNLTRGRFYGLLSGYALAAIMAALVFILSLVIFDAAAAIIAGGPDQAAKLFDGKDTDLADLYTPIQIFGHAYFAVIDALTAAILVGARAQAFLQISKLPPVSVVAG
jgi:hypothetical protein